MIDMQSITVAFGSLKAATDIVKGLSSLKTAVEIQSVAFELNGKILEAQQALFAAHSTQTTLIERVRELERQIAGMEHWETEKQRYKLATPFPGCVVYALQRSMSDGEPAYYLCVACFQKGQKSILQGREGIHGKAGISRRFANYHCSSCKSEATTQWMNVVPPQYFEDIGKKPE